MISSAGVDEPVERSSATGGLIRNVVHLSFEGIRAALVRADRRYAITAVHDTVESAQKRRRRYL